MTTQDLFRCIGNLSDTMIEESADIRRKKRWLPIAALAACAVLAISIPLAVRSANSTKSASTADTSAAMELLMISSSIPTPQYIFPSFILQAQRLHAADAEY